MILEHCAAPGGNQSFPLWQIWSKPLSASKHALLLINLSPKPRDITANFDALSSLKSPIELRDVWTVRLCNSMLLDICGKASPKDTSTTL